MPRSSTVSRHDSTSTSDRPDPVVNGAADAHGPNALYAQLLVEVPGAQRRSAVSCCMCDSFSGLRTA